ncbi:MAG: hypothetical protein KDD82_01895, partial [Planctomycetes bacterium]|nr:hypothetical protein [Planctomycetota bacterium]
DLRDWAEESRRRPREYGWWAGVSPYLRLTLSLVFNLALVVGMAAFVLWLLKDPAHAWESLRTGKHGHKSDVNAVISLLMAFGLGGFFSVRAGVWLYRWPGVWTETGRLLSFARPQPMRLQVWHEGRGKHRKTYAAFRPVDGSLRGPNPLRQVTLEGILPPLWLRSECARKPVLVYGLEDGQPPFLIEDTSGQLALLYP